MQKSGLCCAVQCASCVEAPWGGGAGVNRLCDERHWCRWAGLGGHGGGKGLLARQWRRRGIVRAVPICPHFYTPLGPGARAQAMHDRWGELLAGCLCPPAPIAAAAGKRPRRSGHPSIPQLERYAEGPAAPAANKPAPSPPLFLRPCSSRAALRRAPLPVPVQGSRLARAAATPRLQPQPGPQRAIASLPAAPHGAPPPPPHQLHAAVTRATWRTAGARHSSPSRHSSPPQPQPAVHAARQSIPPSAACLNHL